MLVDVQNVNSPRHDESLWRYMDFTKLLSLLEHNSLYFARADTFEDPFEGEWPSATAQLFKKVGNTKALQTPRELQQRYFISCWCCSEYESAALWKLYLQSVEGVAIRTDAASLAAALESAPQKITLAKVGYIDYDSNTQIPWTKSYVPLFTRKRRSFSHEREVRAIFHSSRMTSGEALGIAIPVSVPALIKKIYVAPTAPSWFAELVERVVRRFGVDIAVERSKLYQRPVH